jgi:beta-lactamase regulating signal transducer with metallopeptidase domain
MTVEGFNSWSMTMTAIAAAVLWQSALLAGVAAGLCWLLRRSSPVGRYWCWQIVALKLLVMPWWVLAVPLPGIWKEAPPAIAAELASDATSGPEADTPPANTTAALEQQIVPTAPTTATTSHRFAFLSQLSWHSWLVIAWLGGVALLAGRTVLQQRRLQQTLGCAMPATEPRLLAMVDQAAAQLGLRRAPRLLLIEADVSPFVCGLFRPVVVLPRSLLGTLDTTGWRQVLLHELAHLKRHDLWWGWLPEIARLIYFFHPVAHWLCSRIRLERELACDQLAMALSGESAADYAMVLVQVVSHASTPPALQAAASLGLDGGIAEKNAE